ncbi:hypothetical protein COB57_04965 [Candidatus Peregrinibacteria bacterium]|nr:MAG: hypothetical protein COB57_04965 [Candidatus Peregrinibacteria bacterium]
MKQYFLTKKELSYLLQALSYALLWGKSIDEMIYIYDIKSIAIQSLYKKIIQKIDFQTDLQKYELYLSLEEFNVVFALTHVSCDYDQQHFMERNTLLYLLNQIFLDDITKSSPQEFQSYQINFDQIKNNINFYKFNLSGMEVLDLGNNFLCNINNFKVGHIESLYLTSNNITSINLKNIKNLKVLNVFNNPIKYIHPETITEMRKIPNLMMDNSLDNYDKNGYLKQGIFSRIKQIFNK